MSFVLERLSDNHIPSVVDNTELYNLRSNNIANARGQSALQWKCMTFHALSCFANAICLACACFGSQQPAIQPLLTLFSLAAVIFHGFKTFNELKFHRSIYGETFSSKKQTILLGILVGVFYLMHPLAITSEIILTVYSLSVRLNSILTAAVTLRIISILYFLVVSSRFYGARAARVLQIYAAKQKLSLWYAIRCIYKTKTIKVPLFFMLLILSLVPFLRMQFEQQEDRHADFIQELYDTVITMTTVGYGDIDHSQSLFVRILMVCIVLLGSLTSSLMTVTVINFFELKPNESRAFQIHRKLKLIQSLKIQRMHYFKSMISKNRSQNECDLQTYRENIRDKRKNLRLHHAQGFVHGHLSSQFVNVQKNLKKVAEKQLLINNIMEFYFSRGKGTRVQPKSPKSAKSRKRAGDSATIGKLFDRIVKN